MVTSSLVKGSKPISGGGGGGGDGGGGGGVDPREALQGLWKCH